MRPDVQFSLRAEADLEAIIAFLFTRSARAAERFADEFDRTTARLMTFPESGAPRRGGRRIAPIGSTGYVTIYSFREGTLRLLRIKHGAQNE